MKDTVIINKDIVRKYHSCWTDTPIMKNKNKATQTYKR